MERLFSFLLVVLATVLLPTDFYTAIVSAPVAASLWTNASETQQPASEFNDTYSKETQNLTQPCESGDENCTFQGGRQLRIVPVSTLNEKPENISSRFESIVQNYNNASTFTTTTHRKKANRTVSSMENQHNTSDIVVVKTVTTSTAAATTSKGTLRTSPSTTTTRATTSSATTTTTQTPSKATVASRREAGVTSTRNDKKHENSTKTSTGQKPGKQSEYLAHHFTGFVQNVWLPNPTPHTPNPADDGPFGSILWRDKKYLVSVLIPVGVGFTGAIMIIVMAYVSRAWRKRKERARAQGSPRSFLEAATSKTEDTCPLHESSDDEF